MNADFLDASDRHWKDGEHLYASNRWANADQLFGLAAECGLKRLMIAFGMPLRANGDPSDRDDWVHADEAWMRYEIYRSGHISGVNYGLPDANPFIDWRVLQRYAHRTHFDQTRVAPHRTGADHIRALIQKAIVEGLL
jgi:hypothetical protein